MGFLVGLAVVGVLLLPLAQAGKPVVNPIAIPLKWTLRETQAAQWPYN